MTGVEMLDKSPTVGTYPTLKLSSTGCATVQYSVYLYSPTKKVWENVSGGYTASVAGNGSYSIKLKKPLHEGENSFSVWVKKAGASPINKGGYDDFQSYRVTAGTSSSVSQMIPSIKSVSIDSIEQKVGVIPNLKVSSNGDGKVEYKVYLYSSSKKVWEDVTGGYSEPVDAVSTTSLKLNKPLHEGENSFSVWVKRAGKTPVNKEGYDNFSSYRVTVKSSGEPEGEGLLPTIKSVGIDSSQQKVGIKPIINLTSTGSEKVEYRVYLYSPSKKVWEDVTGGYTTAQDPLTTYKMQSNIPLHEGENSFSVWVKRAGKTPANKEGYDSFSSYRINVTEKSNIIPEITSVGVDNLEIKLGGQPTITLKSNADISVQYSIYLYSQSKDKWENVSNGYSDAVNPTDSSKIKITQPLQPGRNKFSIWVKRAGYAPSDPGGYDSYVHEVVDVSINTAKTPVISEALVNPSKINEGTKPELTLLAAAGDESNISYKTFLYSNNQGKWIDASSYTEGVKSGTKTTIALNTPLEAGTNKVLVWAKRAWVSGEVYEDYKIIEINAIKPAPLKKKIVIDPGHGGKDPGAVSTSGTRERDIALSVSLKLADILKASGYEILYTRTQNDTVNWNSLVQAESLRYRADFANSNGADLFVSVHCNAGGGTGTETLYSESRASKDQALATSIQQELVKSIGLRDRGIKPRSIYVLNNTNMSASLVELAFIDTASDEAKLKDPTFQQRAAQGIANGVVKYLVK